MITIDKTSTGYNMNQIDNNSLVITEPKDFIGQDLQVQKATLIYTDDPVLLEKFLKEIDNLSSDKYKTLINNLYGNDYATIASRLSTDQKKELYANSKSLALIDSFIRYDKDSKSIVSRLSIDRIKELLFSCDDKTEHAANILFSSLPDEEKQKVISDPRLTDTIKRTKDYKDIIVKQKVDEKKASSVSTTDQELEEETALEIYTDRIREYDEITKLYSVIYNTAYIEFMSNAGTKNKNYWQLDDEDKQKVKQIIDDFIKGKDIDWLGAKSKKAILDNAEEVKKAKDEAKKSYDNIKFLKNSNIKQFIERKELIAYYNAHIFDILRKVDQNTAKDGLEILEFNKLSDDLKEKVISYLNEQYINNPNSEISKIISKSLLDSQEGLFRGAYEKYIKNNNEICTKNGINIGAEYDSLTEVQKNQIKAYLEENHKEEVSLLSPCINKDVSIAEIINGMEDSIDQSKIFTPAFINEYWYGRVEISKNDTIDLYTFQDLTSSKNIRGFSGNFGRNEGTCGVPKKQFEEIKKIQKYLMNMETIGLTKKPNQH